MTVQVSLMKPITPDKVGKVFIPQSEETSFEEVALKLIVMAYRYGMPFSDVPTESPFRFTGVYFDVNDASIIAAVSDSGFDKKYLWEAIEWFGSDLAELGNEAQDWLNEHAVTDPKHYMLAFTLTRGIVLVRRG